MATRFSKIKRVDVSFEQALEEFLLVKKESGKSERTIQDYSWYCHKFYELNPYFPDAFLMKKSASEWLKGKISPYTYNLRLTYNKAFFRYCIEREYLIENPMQNFTVKKTEPRIVQNSPEILIKLLNQPDLSTFVGLRDYCMILLTLDTGIRPSEIRQLMSTDFDSKKGILHVSAEVSKTRTGRTLPLQPTTISIIKRLQACKPQEWTNAPIFSTNEGTMMLARAWQDRIKLYSRRIGEKITPYDLRHDFALLYLKNGGNVFTLQKMMGHKTLEMTRRYIDIDIDELQRMACVASPINILIRSKRKICKL